MLAIQGLVFQSMRCIPVCISSNWQSSVLRASFLLLTGLLITADTVLLPLPSLADPAVDAGPSILRPDTPATKADREYRFPIDFIDPTPATNPKGADSSGLRGMNQLNVYTRAYGESTRTSASGVEAVVRDGRVTDMGGSDSPIPENGFVISAHGSAAQWLDRFAKPGALVSVDGNKSTHPGGKQELVIRFTPDVYLFEVDSAIKRAESRPPANRERYEQFLQQAKACREQLSARAAEGLSPELAATANACRADADRAFYNTVESRSGEFRGAWIRPEGTDPERVRKAIAGLKQAKIRHVFLETYYQGKTIYPSDVMAEYGLPTQHPQYVGADPLRLWLDEAHKENIQVHLWVQVFFAGNAQENIEQFGPILQKYPSWRNVQRPHWNIGYPVPSDIEPGHYFLDPANAEARAFLEKLLLEMASRYQPDGLNLDYIRYPASARPNKPYYLGTTWGYTETARKQFRELIDRERQAAVKKLDKPAASPAPASDPKDLTPASPLWPRWVAWRKEQVSSFVKLISEKSRAIRPDMLISAVIFPSADSDYAQKLQDYPRWAKEGAIQALTPIGLSPLPDWMVDQSLKLKAQVPEKFPVYIGVFGMYNRTAPIDLLAQIEAVRRADMPGLVLFDYASRLTPEYREALTEGPFRE
jgi:uncharacterized lipoprotein YddW (UPF0748 family)